MIPMIYQGGGRFTASSTYHAKRCDRLYGEGEEVLFDHIDDRSMASHRHYFARIKELWEHLPEHMDDFANPEELRHKMLVDTGYYTEKRLVFRNNAEAIAGAAYIAEVGEWLYCSVYDNIVVVRKPMSQSMRAMKKKKFEQSKADVLDAIERLIRREPPKDNVIPFNKETRNEENDDGAGAGPL